MNLKVQDVSIDANLVHFKVAQAVKKGITSHKLGETGFKANVSGSYFNALDSVNDTFKFLEDAINSTGLNTPERKYLTIGINANGQDSFLEEQNRYDMEGPKNLFDQGMLADYFLKMSNDHPLLAYIEDPCAEGDIVGYQKIMRRFKDTQVKIGVKNWFGSDLEGMQEYTQMVQEQSESEEEEKEIDEEEQKRLDEEAEAKRLEEEELAAQAAAEAQAKGGKGKAPPAGLKKGETAEHERDPDLPAENDPNVNKFIPDVIHFDKTKHQSTEPFDNIVRYQMFLKEDEQFSLCFDDSTYESR